MAVVRRFGLWLRLEGAGRRWVLVVVVVFLVFVAFVIGEALLPHRVLNTILEHEEKSNGIREFSHGITPLRKH
jgi:hypothetical protein